MELPKQIIGLVVVFGVMNLVLWGGQELYHREDTKKINEIKAYLEIEGATIDSLERNINAAEVKLEQRESELNRLQSLGYIYEYNASVDSFNSFIDIYERNIDDYDTKIAEYNVKIEEANALIEKSGSRWYLIPIPFGGGTKSKLPSR